MARRLAVAIVAVALAASVSRADRPPLKENHTTWWLPVGFSGGAGGFLSDEEGGVFIAAEVSLVRYHPHDVPEISGRLGDTITTPWYGVYTDVGYDVLRQRTRLTLGPEVGWGMLGLDGGLAVELGGDHVVVGAALRGLLMFPASPIYLRVELLPGASDASSVWVEGGVLFKVPIPLM